MLETTLLVLGGKVLCLATLSLGDNGVLSVGMFRASGLLSTLCEGQKLVFLACKTPDNRYLAILEETSTIVSYSGTWSRSFVLSTQG